MSQEDVAIVRRFIEGTNETGDFPWKLTAPDIVYVIAPPAWLAGHIADRRNSRTH
jgi:hypothetical protein